MRDALSKKIWWALFTEKEPSPYPMCMISGGHTDKQTNKFHIAYGTGVSSIETHFRNSLHGLVGLAERFQQEVSFNAER